MSELTHLIARLQKGVENKASFISTIRHPALLIVSLRELNSLIGNGKVKDSVATQVSHLIMTRRRAVQDPRLHKEGVMLNTVLYGPPGVGKTLVGSKLAKIWYALGYLNTENVPAKKGKLDQVLGDIFEGKDGASAGSRTTSTVTGATFLCMSVVIICYVFMKIYKFSKAMGPLWFSFFTALLVAALLSIAALANNSYTSPGQEKSAEKELPASKETSTALESSIIKVVTRADFVDKYLGWTAIKTTKLLEESLGKVLFVDEAYSLLNGPHDEYGMEALTALNLFLSQHASEIIVIFAGYKDLLELGPFTVQPGLTRRFMWQFECEGYTAHELFAIFITQAGKQGWKINKAEEVSALFLEQQDAFVSYAGDTERVAYFAGLEHDRDYVRDPTAFHISTLDPVHVRRAIEKLRENNIKARPTQSSSNPFANVLRMMTQNTADPTPLNAEAS